MRHWTYYRTKEIKDRQTVALRLLIQILRHINHGESYA